MTGGSRAATMAGGATLHTARALKERILDVSSRLLEASPGDLEIADGKVAVRGVPVSAITLADVAAAAASDDELEVNGEFDGGKGGWSGGTLVPGPALVGRRRETGRSRQAMERRYRAR